MGAFGGPDIITDGLVFAVDPGSERSYPGSGTTTTSLVGLNTGTLTNGVAFSSNNGGSWEFDGTDDFISFASNSDQLSDNGSYTLSAWLKPDGSSWGNNAVPLYNTYNQGAGSFGIWHHFGHDNMLRWRHQGASYTYGEFSGVGLVANTWQLTTITWDTTTIKLYKNAVLQNSSTSPSNFNRCPTKPSIGRLANRTTGNVYPWNGETSNHQVYNRALTAAEISQNYNAQKNRFI